MEASGRIGLAGAHRTALGLEEVHRIDLEVAGLRTDLVEERRTGPVEGRHIGLAEHRTGLEGRRIHREVLGG